MKFKKGDLVIWNMMMDNKIYYVRKVGTYRYPDMSKESQTIIIYDNTYPFFASGFTLVSTIFREEDDDNSNTT